jgi:hypothetical protein
MSGRPFRLRAPVTDEDSLQTTIARALDVLLLPPAVWWAMPIGHIPLSGAQAAKLVRIGLKRNLPDLFVLHQGTLHGIELKRAGARLSRTRTVRTRNGGLRVLDGQVEAWPRWQSAGMRLTTAHSLDDVLAYLEAVNVPLRGHA